MKQLILLFLLPFYFTSAAQHSNIMISNADNPEEPSISISTKDPRFIVAGANIRSVYYSSDTGRTWVMQQLSSTFGVYGDPAITCDTSGNFHFFHLSDPPGAAFLDQIVVQRSTDHGQNWSSGTSIGMNPSKVQDKQWPAVDRRNNNIYTSWTQFDEYGSANPNDSSHILFSRSVDGGLSWSSPVRLDEKGGDCLDSDSTVEGAVPAIGPNGEVYVAWAGPQGLMFDRSLDGGLHWMDHDILVSSIPGGWDLSIPGIYRANGLPVTTCDTSNGPNRGTIYVNWCDQRNGVADTDVWLVKSTDGGNTWSAPIRVNDDGPGRHQWFTWMAIDQLNGDLYFVFYDRRQYADTRTDVYMARSTDGGNSFRNFRISAAPFAPTASIFFGDYNNISVEKGIVRPIWTRLDSGHLSVWTAIVDTAAISSVVTSVITINNDVPVEAYPNPFTNESFVSFKLRRPGQVSVEVFDITGKLVAVPISNRWYPSGKFVERIYNSQTHIAPGNYLYRITVNGVLYTRRMIRVE